jgi:hypothetical protein
MNYCKNISVQWDWATGQAKGNCGMGIERKSLFSPKGEVLK